MARQDHQGGSYSGYPAHIIYTDSNPDRFVSMGTLITFPKDTVLYRAGEIPDYCYYIKTGLVKSFEYTDEGEERIYSLVDEGSLLLELSALLRTPLPMSFATATKVTAVRISSGALLDAFSSQPEVMSDFLWSVNAKFLSILEQLRQSASQSADWKVCNLLMIFANRFGVDYDGKVLIREKLSQQKMADLLRVSRITVVRAVKELKDMGLVEQVNGYYCIRNMEKLRQHMRYSDALQ